MNKYSVVEAKANWNAIIKLVEDGESVFITKDGKPIVRMIPAVAAKPITLQTVQKKLAAQGITERDVAKAVTWARKRAR